MKEFIAKVSKDIVGYGIVGGAGFVIGVLSGVAF